MFERARLLDSEQSHRPSEQCCAYRAGCCRAIASPRLRRRRHCPVYVPPAFREDDRTTLHAAIKDARLSHLVTATTEGLFATPLPLFLAPDEGPHGTLYGHVSRANGHWKLEPIGEAMALFMGPHAYVSPSWYPSKQEHHKVVPTWNYLAVHAYGPVEFFEDADRLLDVVTRLTDLH